MEQLITFAQCQDRDQSAIASNGEAATGRLIKAFIKGLVKDNSNMGLDLKMLG